MAIIVVVIIAIIWRAVSPKSFNKFRWGCILPLLIADIILIFNFNSISNWMDERSSANFRAGIEKIQADAMAREKARREFDNDREDLGSRKYKINSKLQTARADVRDAPNTESKILATQRLLELLNTSLEQTRRSIQIAEDLKKLRVDNDALKHIVKDRIEDCKREEKETLAEIKQVESRLSGLKNQ